MRAETCEEWPCQRRGCRRWMRKDASALLIASLPTGWEIDAVGADKGDWVLHCPEHALGRPDEAT